MALIQYRVLNLKNQKATQKMSGWSRMKTEHKLKFIFATTLTILSLAILYNVTGDPPKICRDYDRVLNSEELRASILEPIAASVEDSLEDFPPLSCDPALDSSICYSPELQEEAADSSGIPCKEQTFFPGRKFGVYCGAIMLFYATLTFLSFFYKAFKEYRQWKKFKDQIIDLVPPEAYNKRTIFFTFGPMVLDDSDSDSDSDAEVNEKDNWC